MKVIFVLRGWEALHSVRRRPAPRSLAPQCNKSGILSPLESVQMTALRSTASQTVAGRWQVAGTVLIMELIKLSTTNNQVNSQLSKFHTKLYISSIDARRKSKETNKLNDPINTKNTRSMAALLRPPLLLCHDFTSSHIAQAQPTHNDSRGRL